MLPLQLEVLLMLRILCLMVLITIIAFQIIHYKRTKIIRPNSTINGFAKDVLKNIAIGLKIINVSMQY